MVLTCECSIIPAQSLVQLCLPEGYLRRCDVCIIHPGSIITSGIFLQYKEKCRLLTQVIVKNIFILFIIIIENIWGTRKGDYKLKSESDPIEFLCCCIAIPLGLLIVVATFWSMFGKSSNKEKNKN